MLVPARDEDMAFEQGSFQDLNPSYFSDVENFEQTSRPPDASRDDDQAARSQLSYDLDRDSMSVFSNDLGFSEDELVELVLLRDEEIDAVIEKGLLSKDERWNIDRREGYQFVYPEMILDIFTGAHYPVEPLTFMVTNVTLPRIVVDQLRVALRDIHAHDTRANSFDKWLNRASSETGSFQFEHVALHLSAKADSHIKQFRLEPTYWRTQPKVLQKTDYHLSRERREYLYYRYHLDLLHDPTDPDNKEYDGYDPLNPDWSKRITDLTAEQKLILANVQHQSEIKDSMFGIDASSVHGHDLANSILDLLKTPEMTFHCTREDLIPSIVRQGFIIPEEKAIRCGSTYGRGIYSSPDPTFSLMYTHFRQDGATKVDEFAGLKLIVCATIMGRCSYVARDDNWRDQNEPWPGSHSHCANDMMEYVIFDPAQIIPCYVIHLDLGRDIATYVTNLSSNTSQYIHDYRAKQRKKSYADKQLGLVVEGPGDVERQKQALLAKAQKQLGYGFGPASGSKFVVLDVADVSEDEEDYGNYQKERVNGAEKVDIWAGDGHRTLALDSDDQSWEEEESGSGHDAESDFEKEEGQEPIAWEHEMGPEGKTKFDEYYEARKAKSKN
ncbi:hypothetical protein P7C71_g3979, partial [Lecanoromycetidae sp. Uapishka_2]